MGEVKIGIGPNAVTYSSMEAAIADGWGQGGTAVWGGANVGAQNTTTQLRVQAERESAEQAQRIQDEMTRTRVSRSTAEYNLAVKDAKAARNELRDTVRGAGYFPYEAIVEARKMANQVAEEKNIKPGTKEYIKIQKQQLQQNADAWRASINNPVIRGNTADNIRAYAEKYGMSIQAAADLIDRYGRGKSSQTDPNTDPEFAKLTTWQLADLEKFGGLSGGVYPSVIRQDAYKRIKKYINTDGSLNLSEVVEAGTDIDTIKAAGFDVSEKDVTEVRKQLAAIKAVGKMNLYEALEKGVERKHLVTLYGENEVKKVEDFRLNNIIIDGMYMSNEDYNDLDPKYRSLALKSGFGKMNEAIMADREKAAEVSEDNKDYEEALEAMKGYLNEDGSYSVGEALLKRNDKLNDAIDLLFDPEDIKEIKYKLAPALTIGTGEMKEVTLKETESFLEGIKPLAREPSPNDTREERLGIIKYRFNKTKEALEELSEKVGLNKVEDAALKAGLPAILVRALPAAAGAVALEPTPGGETLLALALITVMGGVAAANFYRKFKNDTGEIPNTDNVKAVVVAEEEATLVGPNTLYPGLIIDVPPKVDAGEETFPITPIATELETFPATPQKGQTMITPGQQPEAVLLITPQSPIGHKATDYILKAQTEVRLAEVDVKDSIKNIFDGIVLKPGENLPAVVKKTNTALQKREEIKKAFSAVNSALQKGQIEVDEEAFKKAFIRSYDTWRKKMAILAAARKQYIASLNPEPIYGKVDEKRLIAIAGQQLRDSLSYGTEKKASPEELEKALKVVNESLIKSLADVYQRAYEQAIARNLTSTQAKSKADTALDTAIAEAIDTRTVMRTAERTKAKTLSKAAVKQAVAQAVANAEAVRPAVNEAARTAELADTLTLKTTKLTIPKLPKGKMSSKEKLAYIEAADTVLAWRQGEPGERPLWYIIAYKGNERAIFHTRRKPEGGNVINVTGEGSAKKSAGLVRGKKPQATDVDMGVKDVNIRPGSGVKKVNIGFSNDPQQRTTGDLNVKDSIPLEGSKVRLTERGGLPRANKGLPRERHQLPGRGRVRITPKRGRLPK